MLQSAHAPRRAALKAKEAAGKEIELSEKDGGKVAAEKASIRKGEGG